MLCDAANYFSAFPRYKWWRRGGGGEKGHVFKCCCSRDALRAVLALARALASLLRSVCPILLT